MFAVEAERMELKPQWDRIEDVAALLMELHAAISR